MSDEPFALSTVPPAPPAPGDYDAICATVMESARGRWFLAEYARRNRNSDTRLVLDAIERIDAVIRDQRGQQAYQSFRSELLDMARAIVATRAEVAEINPQAGRSQVAEGAAPPAPDIFAAAERIQEVVWAMRERGLDPPTCDRIEALAASILSASSLRDPDDRRARKLAEVLQYLERRINAMLDSCAESARAASEEDGAAGTSQPVAAGDQHAAGGGAADGETAEVVEAKVGAATGTLPSPSDAERESAAATMLPEGLEMERVGLAGLERDPASAPAALDDAMHGQVEAAPAPEPEPEPQIEVAELELEPLVVVPAEEPAAEADTPAIELELAPIVVAAALEPDARATLASAAAAPSAADPSLPAAERISEPDLDAPVQPEAAPAAAGAPPAEAAAPAELELEPIAIELAATADVAAAAPIEPPWTSEAAPADSATAEAIVPVEPPMVAAVAPIAAEPQPAPAEVASDTFECNEPAEAEPRTTAEVGSLATLRDAPTADRSETIAAELDPVAAAPAAPTEEPSAVGEHATVAPLPAAEPAPQPESGDAAQAELEALAPTAAEAPGGDTMEAAPAPATTAAEPVEAALALPIVTSPPAAARSEESEDEPAQPPRAAAVPDLPGAPVELPREHPALTGTADEPAAVALKPPASELAVEPHSDATEPEAAPSVGQAVPVEVVKEEPALAPSAGEIAAELPSAVATVHEAQAPPPEPEPPREIDMLSAAWETEVSRPDIESAAPVPVSAELPAPTPAPADLVADAMAGGAIEGSPSPAPRATMPSPLPEAPPADPTSAAELADFLLDPLPPPLPASAAREPGAGPALAAESPPSPVDAMTELEEELFAAPPVEDTALGSPLPPPPAAEQPPPSLQSAAVPSAATTLAKGTDVPPEGVAPLAAATATAPPIAPARTATKPMPRATPSDPLAALKAMSDEERIALFT